MSVTTVFFGSRQPAVITFKKILPLPYLDISTIVTKTSPQLSKIAKKNNIPLLEPNGINPQAVEQITNLQPQLGILASYGEIIPLSLLSLFPKNIINIHPSLLPRHRGPSPVAAAILQGDSKTGVSLMLLDEKLDHGPIIAQKTIPLPPPTETNRRQLTQKLFQLGAQLLADRLPDYLAGKTTPQPQDHSQATFTKPLKRNDGLISFDQLTAAVKKGEKSRLIIRKIAAFTPWPGVYSLFPNIKKGQNKPVRVKILKAHRDNDHLALDRVHFAGKTPITWNKNLQKLYFHE